MHFTLNRGKDYIPANCTTIKVTDDSKSKLIFLCNFLQSNDTVKIVDLFGKLFVARVGYWSRPFGYEGPKLIAKVLKVNCTITELNLGANGIGDEGAEAIAEALKVNRTVTTLYLRSNCIGAEGAKAIAEALKVNCTVTKLHLGGNGIGDEGAKAIAEVLKINRTITDLNLDYNSIEREGANAIFDALKVNSTITKLHLWDWEPIDRGAHAIAEAAKANRFILDGYLQCKTMALGLFPMVPIYVLLDIHEIVFLLNPKHQTFLKLLDKKTISKKRLLSMIDKIYQQLMHLEAMERAAQLVHLKAHE